MTSSLREISSLIYRHTRPGVGIAILPGLRLITSSAPTEPANSVCRPAFALIAQGAKRTVLSDKVFEYAAGQYLVASVDLPIVSQIVRASDAEPYLAVSISLSPATIATLLLEAAASDSGPAEPAGLFVSSASADLLDSAARLLRLLDRPHDVAVLGPMFQREIHWRLLNGEQGAMVRQIGLADSRLSQISRAMQWIRDHYSQTLQTRTLTKLAGMSAATFYRHFRAITAMSPLQYQKQIRLQEARARLIMDPKDVAAVGFDVGYDSPSQFSREYSRLFGVPPGKDMKRLRPAG